MVNACKPIAGEAGKDRSLGRQRQTGPWEAETDGSLGNQGQVGPWECWPVCLIGKIKFSKRLYARKSGGGAGEIAWGSRALAALAEVQFLTPASEAHNHPKLHFHGICCLLLTFTGRCMYMMHTHALHSQNSIFRKTPDVSLWPLCAHTHRGGDGLALVMAS